jgi:heterodisulfide reductase subunit D
MPLQVDDILSSLDQRVNGILDACTACGACTEVCPVPGIDNISVSDSKQITSGVLDILRTGSGPQNAELWAEGCCGSGYCKTACEHGINPRFMLTMARRAMSREQPDTVRKQQGKDDFKQMSRGVRLISRLQTPPELMARLSPSSHPDRRRSPDLIFYTGCNMLKTPHIGLLCMDVLDRLDAHYEVHGGPANCCGILQLRTGDDENSVRQGSKTIERFTETGASEILSWCPTCQIQFGENLLPSYGAEDTQPFDITMFPVFLARHLDRLQPMMTTPVEKRVALHEYPGSEGVTEAVVALLSAIPGLEIVGLDLPRAGYQMSSLTNPDYAKKHLASLLRAGEDAGITTFAGIYHADHRELLTHEPNWPFEIVNYMDLIGQSIGLNRPDVFKKLKLMQDVDQIMAEAKSEIVANKLNPEDVRDVILSQMLSEQVLDTDPSRHPSVDG